MEWANFGLNAVIGILGLIGGGFGAWLISVFKERASQSIAVNEQAVNVYRELFEKINKKAEALETLVNEIEKSSFEEKGKLFKVTLDLESRNREIESLKEKLAKYEKGLP